MSLWKHCGFNGIIHGRAWRASYDLKVPPADIIATARVHARNALQTCALKCMLYRCRL